MEESKRRKRVDWSLSQEAIDKAKREADKLGLTVSRYIEMIIRTAGGDK